MASSESRFARCAADQVPAAQAGHAGDAGVIAPARPGPLSLDALQHRATITVAEAASLLGIGRNAAYEAARCGQLPVLRVGRRIIVPVPALLRLLEGEGRA